MDSENGDGQAAGDLLRLSATIVAAYVGQNTVSTSVVPGLIDQVHKTLNGLGRDGTAAPPEKQKPALPISRSVQHDVIICLEDGNRLNMLKHSLRSRYRMSVDA